MTLPALTLHQPWAFAIAHAGKDVENRSWKPPPGVNRILIHAGKAWDAAGLAKLRELGCPVTADVTRKSAIVAVADIAAVCDGYMFGCDCGPWQAGGQYHWRLTNVRKLARPVPCSGRQRLWHPEPAVLADVQNQVVEVLS